MTSLIHDALAPISWLAGRWSTDDGQGTYPDIPDFKYHEDIEFTCIGQPMFNYMTMAQHPEKKIPMHQERGFLRIKPGTNEIAFIVSHNFGLASIEEGVCDPDKKELTLETVEVTRISLAKPPFVKKYKRIFKLLTPDTLEVTLFMETDTTPLTEHLKAVYKKIN